jgi:hypothetical protein
MCLAELTPVRPNSCDGWPGMTALAQSDRTRLVKMLAMLGSDHPGERDAAGLAAHRLLQKRGLTWDDVMSPRPAERRMPEFGTWRETCRRLLEQPRALRAWERSFLADLPNFPRISTKQRYVLGEIAKRVLGDRA